MRRLCWFRLGCVAALYVIGMQFTTAQILGQPGFGVGGIGSPAPATAASELDAGEPPLNPMTEEFHVRRSSDRSPNGDKSGLGDGGQTGGSVAAESHDEHVKRQGYLLLRTVRVHPQPDLRHATDRYEAIDVSDSEAEASIRRALERPVPEAIQFEELALRAVIDRLAGLTGVPFVPDMQALTDAGIDLDATTITQRLPTVSLRSALRILLRDVGLTYLIRDEVLLITTKEKAQENLVVRIYPVPGQVASRELVDLIHTTVAAETWDIVGGQGAITLALQTNSLVISQTQEVHEEITDLLRRVLDGDLGPASPEATTDPKAIPTRLYTVRDERLLQELGQKLAPLVNAALGTAGDTEAKVTVIGGKVAVQSRKRGFHAYAAETIRAINGVDVTTPEYHGISGSADHNSLNSGMGTMGGFCWVAREVYGPHDRRWLAFREWMLGAAPTSLRSLYAAHGEPFARWLRCRPGAKIVVRHLMDTVLATKGPPPAGT